MTDRLLEVARKRAPKWTGSTELVLLPRDCCRRCGETVERVSYGQLPLFRSHGFGAVLQTTTLLCPTCDWSRISDVTEVSPLERRAS